MADPCLSDTKHSCTPTRSNGRNASSGVLLAIVIMERFTILADWVTRCFAMPVDSKHAPIIECPVRVISIQAGDSVL